MATSYIGVNGTARKINKIYVGVNGVARKVKKMYIGVNGIARKVFDNTSINYYGASTLPLRAYDHAATSVGDYALFGGGDTSLSSYSSRTPTLYATYFNKSLVRGWISLSKKRYNLSAESVGDYAIFAGGWDLTHCSNVDAVSSSLVLTTTSLPYARSDMSSTSTDNHAFFSGGGYTSGSGSPQYYNDLVTIYDKSLTQSSLLTSDICDHAGASVGDYALFAGGRYANTGYTTQVNIIDKSLTRSIGTSLSVAKYDIAGASVGDYALFAGGTDTNTRYDTVEVYNKSLTKSIATSLSEKKCNPVATSVGDYALFGGGDASSDSNGSTIYNSYLYTSTAVDIYNKSLTRSIGTSLSVARSQFAATSVGDYAIFGGGYISGTGAVDVADIYNLG